MTDIIETLTDVQRDQILRAAWESNPKRPTYDDAVALGGVEYGRALMDVARDAFAAVRTIAPELLAALQVELEDTRAAALLTARQLDAHRAGMGTFVNVELCGDEHVIGDQ